ncbi:unnamed protein product [Caenorhabditis auriculariae]|uniref:Uncharacterized protein n=1 Tax=Caenorhabditis auriculariae TaxID=2777116 RepID=A0A8S1H1N2_9PELO|nr:unnamed protein product [Caenorhabditis auriculariae]
MLAKLSWLLLFLPFVSSSLTNESARDKSSADIWLVVIMCLVFCFAVRHANDFYTGDTVTLVGEGEWGTRFSRNPWKKRRLQFVERDFKEMFDQLQAHSEAEAEVEDESDGCCSYYEEPKIHFNFKKA